MGTKTHFSFLFMKVNAEPSKGNGVVVFFVLYYAICQVNYFCEAQIFDSINSNAPLNFLRPSVNSGISRERGLEFRQREVLNESSNSILEWEIDRSGNSITFILSTSINVSETSTLFLGLSRSGHVDGADIVAIRMSGPPSEQPYLVDMHGPDNTSIAPDTLQNWELVNYQQNSSGVFVSVSRPLDTCDEQDIVINNDLLRIIWRFNDSSPSSGDGSMNFVPEGSLRAYLTDPVISREEGVSTFRVSRRFQVPPRHTSYWCTIHRGPQLPRKHHIVGFTPFFQDPVSRQHVHHQLAYRCITPPGIDPALIFEKYVDHPGEECYLEENHELPTIFCTEIMHTWGVGGNPFNFPDDVGIPLGQTRNEYYMFETHYDNPESRSDLVVENGVDLHYSSELRPNEGGIIFVGTGVLGLFQVPPQARNFTMAGHCTSECTRQMIPPTGMEIVATMLHAHMTTRQVTLKNFRGNQELPWIQSDHNYDFSFQQMRLLPEPVMVLPGDQLTTECVMDTTSRNGTTLAGFATTDEMCVTFLIVKKSVPYLYCSSEYPTQRTMASYGIQNMTWNQESQERVINAAENPEYVGLPLSTVVNQRNWTEAMISDLEMEQLYGEHEATCPRVRRSVMIAYAALFAERLTGGLINTVSQRIEETRPSTRSVSTPPESNMTARYPQSAAIFIPESSCLA